MKSCSVVIRTLNEEEHLGRLLTGIEQQETQPDEVIVVDSGSEDSTLSIAKAFGARVLHIPKEEFSFGRALNIGFAEVKSEIGVALSGHVYPLKRNHLTELLRPFDDPKIAVTYGRQVGSNDSYFSEKRLMLKWFPPHGSGVQQIPFSNNANAATRMAAWVDLPFDEELTGLEDVEFCHRATDQGWDIYYVAEAPVVHIHHEPWGKIRNRYRREARTLIQLDPTQRLSLVQALGLSAMNVWSDGVHSLSDGPSLRRLGSIVKFRSAQFIGSWEGSQLEGKLSPELRSRLFFPAPVRTPEPVAPGPEFIDYGQG